MVKKVGSGGGGFGKKFQGFAQIELLGHMGGEPGFARARRAREQKRHTKVQSDIQRCDQRVVWFQIVGPIGLGFWLGQGFFIVVLKSHEREGLFSLTVSVCLLKKLAQMGLYLTHWQVFPAIKNIGDVIVVNRRIKA